MEQYINKVELQGVVGSVNEVFCRDDVIIKKVALKTERVYKNGVNDVILETSWHNVLIKNSDKINVEFVKEIGKDDKIHIKGFLRNQSYVNSSGECKMLYEIVAQTIEKV